MATMERETKIYSKTKTNASSGWRIFDAPITRVKQPSKPYRCNFYSTEPSVHNGSLAVAWSNKSHINHEVQKDYEYTEFKHSAECIRNPNEIAVKKHRWVKGLQTNRDGSG